MAHARLGVGPVAQLSEQFKQFVVAAVNIADNVERASVAPAVGPERRAGDGDGVHLFWRVQVIDVPETLALQAAHATVKLLDVVMDDPLAKLAVGAGLVALDADAFVDVEDEHHRQHIMLARGADERGAVLRLDAGGVHHDQSPQTQAQPGDIMQRLEGGCRHGLVVRVVADDAAKGIGAEYLRRLEVASREGALAGASRANQGDEAEIGNRADPRRWCFLWMLLTHQWMYS
jgi:hypothetical protein